MISRESWVNMSNGAPEVPEEVPEEVPVETPGEMPGETPDEAPDNKPDEAPNEMPPETPDEVPSKANGIILDEQGILTLAEISSACAVETEYIVELVEEGLITPEVAPESREPQSWRFSGMHIRHARIASHLQGDLGVNLPGVALALQLLDEVEVLRTRLDAMERRE